MPLHLHVNQKSDYDDDEFTATNQAPSWQIPVGLNFLFRNFESEI